MQGNPIHALGRLLPYLRKHKWRLFGILLLIVTVVGIDLSQPMIVKQAIDRYIRSPHPDYGALSWISAVYFGVVALAFGLTFLQEVLLQATGQRIVRDIRADLFKHILGLSVKYFDRNPSGRIITNLVSDTEALNNFFADFLTNTLRGLLTLVVIIFYMFQLDFGFAAWCMAVVPLILVVSRYFQNRLRAVNQEMRGRLSHLIVFLAENLAGMAIVQIFRHEQKQMRQFDDRNRQLLGAMLKENSILLLFFLFTEALSDLGVAALVWFGSGPVIHGKVTFGVLYAFVGFIRRFFQPINTITMQMNILQSMIVASERIAQTMDETPDIAEPPGAETPKRIQGAIRFEDVHLAYRPGKDVLKGIFLEIHPGERIGIVGASGSGKTSLMNLLLRFYDSTKGRILVDGKCIREWPLSELRRTEGMVQQDITLYGGSVLDNIRFFREEIPHERVKEVCRSLGAEPFILGFPGGYEALLTEKGSTLSLGQRQLLSFARVIASDPRILILDEATASLDSETEAILQYAISKIAEGRTLLVVAHRLSTVQHLDKIIVLDNGRIVEVGTHAELLALRKHYYRFYLSGQLVQFQAERPASRANCRWSVSAGSSRSPANSSRSSARRKSAAPLLPSCNRPPCK
jgi:ATP-binding cassette subfamily B protein